MEAKNKGPLRAVVISDLHLGEPASILYNQTVPPKKFKAFRKRFKTFNLGQPMPNALEEIAELIAQIASEEGQQPGEGQKPKIGELILLGDIVDLTLDGSPAYSASKENCKSLLNIITSKVDIDKIVYVPGNHDYNLWMNMWARNIKKYKSSSEKINYVFEDRGPGWDVRHTPVPYNLFGNEYTDNLGVKTEVAYPIYSLYSGQCFYLFHHGHLTSPILLNKGAMDKSKDMNDLEQNVYKKTLKLWGKYCKLKEWGWKRVAELFINIFRSFKLMHPGNLGTMWREDQWGVSEEELHKNIRWFIQTACEIPIRHICNLPDEDFQNFNFHYVFGHTHYGGLLSASVQEQKTEKRLCWVEKNNRRKYVSVWNLGGWIVPLDIFPPYGYVFYIRDDWTAERRLLLSKKFDAILSPAVRQTGAVFYNPDILRLHAEARTLIG